eukprot:5739561-Pyramimonas_sp.AAC.1
MAQRVLTIQRHVLAGDASVTGGVCVRGVSAAEDADFAARCKEMSAWMAQERFKHTTRPYK